MSPGILDFWFEGRYQPYEAADVTGVPMDGNMSVMYAGTKYMFGPDIMLGALAQFDAAQEIAIKNRGSMSGSGWMTGPYTSIRFGPGVVFDGRMAWGTAETDGGYLEDGGETSERRLVRGTLRGSRQYSGWTVTPSVGMSYLEDKPLNQNSAGAEVLSTGRARTARGNAGGQAALLSQRDDLCRAEGRRRRVRGLRRSLEAEPRNSVR